MHSNKKKVTLSLDSKIYSEFQRYCEDHAIMLSKKIELIIKDIMKKKRALMLFLFSFILIFSLQGILGDQIFFDGFEGGTLGGWTLTAVSGANNWTASTIDPYQGTYHAQSQPQSTIEPASVMDIGISTSGYANIKVNYSKKLVGLDSADEFQMEWFDGASWTILEQTGAVAEDDLSYVSKQFSLPSSADNKATFRIKFECTAGGVTEFCRIDDVNVTGNVIDNTPPQFSNHQENPTNNSAYVQGQFYEFNVTITESNLATVKINFNGTNYTNVYARGGGIYSFNRSGLAAGTYPYSWWANDTNGNSNFSFSRDYVITKASTTTSVIAIPNSPITYGNQSNFSCSNSQGLSTTLFVNGIDKSSEKNINLTRAAGSYTVNCTSGTNQNYSASSQQIAYTINNASGQISLFLNGLANNLSITYPQQSNLSASTIYGSVSIYLNGTDVTSQNNLNVTRAAGYYNVTAISFGDANHSFFSITYWLNLSRAASTCSLNFVPGTTIIYGTQVNVSASCTNPETSSNLYRNNSSVNFENGVNVTLAAGFYSYTANVSQTQNYTSAENTSFLIVNKAAPTATLTSSQSWSVLYGISTLINSSELNAGDSDLVYAVYRDGVFVGTSESVVLGVGSYSYMLNTSGGQNYSVSSVLNNNTLFINKADSSSGLTISITPSLSVSYGTQTSASAAESNTGDSDLSYSFYRDGSIIANPNTETLNVGTYIYIYNASGGANYTAGSVNKTLTVNKVASNITLYLNGSQSNLSVSQYQSFSINSTLTQGSGDIYVYVDNNFVHQGIPPYYNLSVFNSPGNYNITAIYQETQNYFSSSKTFWVNVSPAPDTFGPNLNVINPQNIVYYADQDLSLDFLANDASNVSSCWYNIDGGSNISIIGCQNTTFSVSGEGGHSLNLFANDSLGNEARNSVDFSVDLTGVLLSISEPQGIYKSRAGIPISYAIAGNNLTCWYSLNFLTGGLVIPNTTIANCTGASFDLSSDGDYILNLYANNSFGTRNFTNSSFSVDTTVPSSGGSSSGGGSGGGGGGAIPLRFGLSIGNISDINVNNVGIKKILSLKAKNTGTGYLNDCTFKSKGQYASWTTKTETKGLAAGEEYEFIFDVNIPEKTSSGNYKIEIGVVCKEANSSTSFNVGITDKALDFTLDGVERSGQDKVKADYSITELLGEDQNVDIQFFLYDKDGKKVGDINETRFIRKNSIGQFETFIPIPSDLQGELGLLINFNSELYSGFVQEKVILGSPISGFTIFDRIGGRDNFFSLLIVVLFLAFAFFVVRRIRRHNESAKHHARKMIHPSIKKH
ncbi:MAG: hypothetical protein AABW63_04110 [Nanoarchaeota archaeon]